MTQGDLFYLDIWTRLTCDRFGLFFVDGRQIVHGTLFLQTDGRPVVTVVKTVMFLKGDILRSQSIRSGKKRISCA